MFECRGMSPTELAEVVSHVQYPLVFLIWLVSHVISHFDQVNLHSWHVI